MTFFMLTLFLLFNSVWRLSQVLLLARVLLSSKTERSAPRCRTKLLTNNLTILSLPLLSLLRRRQGSRMLRWRLAKRLRKRCRLSDHSSLSLTACRRRRVKMRMGLSSATATIITTSRCPSIWFRTDQISPRSQTRRRKSQKQQRL